MSRSRVHRQPAALDGNLETCRILRRRALVAEQERTIENFDVNPAVLDRLERVRVLHQSARGLLRIGIGSVRGELHAAVALSSLSDPRATIFKASSVNGRCNAFASSHGARIQTSRSSSVVKITGIALG
jgi:hypothetical protein